MNNSWIVWLCVTAIAMALILMVIISEDFISSKIRACSYACDKTDQKMIKYNEQDGCVCSNK